MFKIIILNLLWIPKQSPNSNKRKIRKRNKKQMKKRNKRNKRNKIWKNRVFVVLQLLNRGRVQKAEVAKRIYERNAQNESFFESKTFQIV